MSENQPDERVRLLREIIEDPSYQVYHAQCKAQALSAFRRGRLLRQAATLASLAVVLAATILGGFWINGARARRLAPVRVTGLHPENSTTQGQGTAQPKIPTLTDTELIASFPPNTCSLVEVNGRTVLVFHDAELRQKYLY